MKITSTNGNVGEEPLSITNVPVHVHVASISDCDSQPNSPQSVDTLPSIDLQLPQITSTSTCSTNQSSSPTSIEERSPHTPRHRKVSFSDSGFIVCCDTLICIRVFVLILSVFLLILSVAYCLGQVVETKLDIITVCPESKTQEQIWQQAYQSSLDKHGDVVMSYESQFGWTDDSCW